MNNQFNDSVNKLKESLKGMLNENSSSEDIKRVQELNGLIDGVVAEHQKAEGEISSLKDIIINNVKNSGSEEKPFDEARGDTKSLDEIIKEVGENIEKQRRK